MNSACDVLLNPKTSHQVDSEEIQELVNYEVSYFELLLFSLVVI